MGGQDEASRRVGRPIDGDETLKERNGRGRKEVEDAWDR